MRESRGRSSETSLRLCSRAPRMMSWSATGVPLESTGWVRTSVRHDAARAASRRAGPTSLGGTGGQIPSVGPQGVTRTTRWPGDPRQRTVPADPPALADRCTPPPARLVRTVDALDDAAWADASLLPGWTRGPRGRPPRPQRRGPGRRAARGRRRGSRCAMYPSHRGARRRHRDAGRRRADHPARRACTPPRPSLADAVAAVPADRLDAVVERTPGSERTFAAGAVAAMRLREVEIHHADLDAGYGPADWPADVRRRRRRRRHAPPAPRPWSPPTSPAPGRLRRGTDRLGHRAPTSAGGSPAAAGATD